MNTRGPFFYGFHHRKLGDDLFFRHDEIGNPPPPPVFHYYTDPLLINYTDEFGNDYMEPI